MTMRCALYRVKGKGKEDHTPTERWWGAHLPFYGREPVGG